MTALKLNIGAGPVRIEGYTDIDRLNGDEAYPLTGYEDDSVEEIRASHILEHFGHGEIQAVMTEWIRVLKPGGKIYVAVPNFGYIAEQYQRADPKGKPRLMLFSFAMGGQTTPDDFHRSAWDETMLRDLMMELLLIGCGEAISIGCVREVAASSLSEEIAALLGNSKHLNNVRSIILGSDQFPLYTF